MESGTVKPHSVLIVESLDRLSRAEILTALNLFTGILQADIQIYTVMDRRLYTAQTVNANPTDLIISITVMMRAHEESMTKSKRGLARWNQKRLNAATSNAAMTSRCPSWIKLVGGQYQLIPSHAATIRRIVGMMIAGHGRSAIVRTLNADGTPVVGGCRRWELSSIRSILISPALTGTFQPRQKNGQPVGEPLANYYPAVISDDQYYQMQAVTATRRRTVTAGRAGSVGRNLFGAILHDAKDGERLAITSNGPNVYLLNRACKARGGSGGIRFSYPAFERGFLEFIREVQISTAPETSHAATIEGKIVVVQTKADQLQAAMQDADAATFPRMIQMMKQIEQQIAALKVELEIERAKEHTPEYSTGDISIMADAMPTMEATERVEIRTRIRTAIAAVVERIDVKIQAENRTTKTAFVTVTLRGGNQRIYSVVTNGKEAMAIGTVPWSQV